MHRGVCVCVCARARVCALGWARTCGSSIRYVYAYLPRLPARLRPLHRGNALPRSMDGCTALTRLSVQCSSGLEQHKALASLKSLQVGHLAAGGKKAGAGGSRADPWPGEVLGCRAGAVNLVSTVRRRCPSQQPTPPSHHLPTRLFSQDLSVSDCDWQCIPTDLLHLPLTRLHLRFADFADGESREPPSRRAAFIFALPVAAALCHS